MRSQLEIVQKQLGKDEHGEPRLPPLLREERDLLDELEPVLWVWEDYRDAAKGRGREGGLDGGPTRLDHEKLVWWQVNRGIRAEQWEITALLDIDEAYLRELMTPPEGEEPKESKDGRTS